MKAKYLAYRTKVLGHTWTIQFCSARYYRKICGKGSHGLTDVNDRVIYLKRINFEVVAHELMHAYLEEVCVTPAELDAMQTEEVCCDVVGKYGRTIVKQVDRILKRYEVLRSRL